MRHVFISYSSDDHKAAFDICSFLEARGIECWIAPRDVMPGADYAEEIVRAIEDTEATVLVLSSSANRSPHVRNEIDRAVSNGKAILPVRIEDVQPSRALGLFLATHQWVDAHVPPIQERLGRLVVAIGGILGMQPAPAAVESAQTRKGGQAIVTGNAVFMRAGPTVAAKALGQLNQGDTVDVVDQVTLEESRECLLRQDLLFKPVDGRPYKLNAGKGLVISGETADSYRIEILRSHKRDIGLVPKDMVIMMVPNTWCKVRNGPAEGWVFSRYLRIF